VQGKHYLVVSTHATPAQRSFDWVSLSSHPRYRQWRGKFSKNLSRPNQTFIAFNSVFLVRVATPLNACVVTRVRFNLKRFGPYCISPSDLIIAPVYPAFATQSNVMGFDSSIVISTEIKSSRYVPTPFGGSSTLPERPRFSRRKEN
jgi:hypothetical protein